MHTANPLPTPETVDYKQDSLHYDFPDHNNTLKNNKQKGREHSKLFN